MKHFLLKFNHGVEIGAKLAYLGHYKRVPDLEIYAIATEELHHRKTLVHILNLYGEKPNKTIDSIFKFVGRKIYWACQFCPIWSLNFVARSMELFAIYNYEKLAVVYPEHSSWFKLMASAERRHEEFFR